ncbi:MAG: helix-turn-helix domain-containing protein [Actinomycetota bacterium]|nr:helix-turn-helix domain-containing protein [Actinomycetota bacterium]
MNTLKRIRLLKEFSQGKLAADTGLSRQVISNLERGASRGYPETWKRIAKALDVTVDEILEDPEAEPPRERSVEQSAGTVEGSEEEERRRSVRTREAILDWENVLEALATRYRDAERELREAEPGVFPNEIIDVAVDAGHHRRLLSREADEVKAAPGVNAATEKIRAVSARVERMIEQQFDPMDEAHARHIARFKTAGTSGDAAALAS